MPLNYAQANHIADLLQNGQLISSGSGLCYTMFRFKDGLFLIQEEDIREDYHVEQSCSRTEFVQVIQQRNFPILENYLDKTGQEQPLRYPKQKPRIP